MSTERSVNPRSSPPYSGGRSRNITQQYVRDKANLRTEPADTADALGLTVKDYSLASLRYDLSKLRAKGLVERLRRCRRYRLTSAGYRICVVYLKVFEKLYAPLLNGILKPFKDDAQLHNNRTSLLDRVYRTVSSALDLLVDAVGLRAA